MSTVILNEQCNPRQTLDSAHALQFRLAPPQPWRSVIVWRDGHKPIRPLTKKRLRDLRPGDVVTYEGQRETIYAVEIYR
jgi:hypothetical protein